MGRAEEVSVTYRDRVALIRLNKPKRLNALSLDNFYDIGERLREIDARKDIYVTVITGTGKYFSAGADVGNTPFDKSTDPNDDDRRRAITRSYVVNNLDIANSLNHHSKILVVALNGPIVGGAGALLAFADFVYAAPHAFLLMPFASLGLVAEGATSIGLVQRLGLPKANEVLIMGRRVPAKELEQNGFVNRIFEAPDSETFLQHVFHEVEERLGPHLNQDSLLLIKGLIKAPYKDQIDLASQREAFLGLQRLIDGIPQAEFAKIAKGQKKHKI